MHAQLFSSTFVSTRMSLFGFFFTTAFSICDERRAGERREQRVGVIGLLLHSSQHTARSN